MSTLNENILKVKETFQNIAAAIEEKGVDVGECDSPVTYADKIRSISGSAEGGFDIDKLYVEAYETDAPEPSASVSQTEDGGVMITFGLRRGATGPQGLQGPQGEQGPAGKDGASGTDGKDGIDGSTYEYVYFRGLTVSDKPIDVPSGEGNDKDDYIPSYTKTITVNGNTVELKWSDRAQGVDETYKYEWRSERSKKDTSTWNDFTAPILWAKYGEKGKDGDGIQYIFKNTAVYSRPDNPTPDGYTTDPKYQGLESEEYVPTGWSDDMQDVSASSPYCWVSIRKYKNNKWGPYSNATLWAKYGKDGQDSAGGDGTSGTRFEFIYKRVADESIDVVAPDSVNEDGYEPAEWSLYPKGVTDDLQVEYICQREKEDGIWGEYSDPAIWAMYGKIGRDGNGIEYIYKLTKDETIDPGQPVAPSNIDPESYPSDWSDDPISVNETDTVCWVSTRKQYYNENGDQRWGDYSKPTVWAKYGKDGKEGGGRTIFMFTASDEKTNTPVKPESSEISWDPDTNTITIKEGSIWKSNSDEVSGKYVWLTSGSFNGSGSLLNPGWATPIKITGDDGVAGTDGLTTEFIYRLISNEDNFQQLVEYLSKNPLEVTDTDVVPETNDDICKSIWTDSPLGIDGETWSMEVTCVRTKQPDGSWGPWNGPIRWAVWGEDGIDGDGVEYIFKVTPSDVTNTNISDTHLLYIPPKLWYDNNGYEEIYQTNEFYPGNSDKWPAELNLDWTDEPRDVGPDEPLEWVSIRRKIDGVWGDFSSPKLWAKYAEDGYAYKTSYVFTRSNEKPAIPKDGTDTDFDNPIPVDPEGLVTWSDTVPDGSAQVWMSYKTFSGNPNAPIDEDWSAPILMQDRNDFQVEYSIKESPVNPIGLQNYFDLLVTAGNLEPTSEEVEAEFRKENPDWSDEFETGAIWMATSSYRNGVWTDWNVTRIKGEKGDTGPAGTGIAIRGTFTYDQLVAADAYFANPTGTKPSPYFTDDKLETGNCYMISSGTNSKNEDVTGHMFVYDGSGNNFDERWIDAGRVQGESGQSMYLYMAFADVWEGAVKTLPNGSIDPNGGKYVGYKVSDGALDEDVLLEWDTYNWSKWNGDDGFGVEQIFLLTSKNSKYNEDVAPDVPLDTNITKDYLPEHGLGADAFGSKWSDSPQDVSDGYPYQWVVSRKWDGVNTYPWKGSVDENGESTGKASLYSRYAYDGNGAYRLALSQDYFLIPCEEDGTVDTDFKETVQTSMSLFIGDDPVSEKVTYTAEGYDVVEGVLTLTTEQIKSLPAVTQIVCEAEYNNVITTATFTVEKTQNAYNIEPQVLTIKKDPVNLRPLIDDFNVNVYRWNGTGWSNYTGTILVDFVHTDQDDDYTEPFQVKNGEVNIAVNDEYDLTWIKLYLSEHSKYYEKVDVIMDGKDGKDGKDGADGENGEPGKTPVIYSAGNFDATIAAESGYVGNSNQAPYVFYDEVEDLRGFYIAYGTPKTAPSGDNIIEKDEEVDWINIPNDAAKWILMDKFNAIYSDIGKFNHALVGNWVFHGDYMFSQDGIGYIANDTTKYNNYSKFDNPADAIANWLDKKPIESSNYDWFKPFVLFNQITGEAILGKTTFDTNSESDKNKITIQDNKIVIANDIAEPGVTIINNSVRHRDKKVFKGTVSIDNIIERFNVHIPTVDSDIVHSLFYSYDKIGYVEASTDHPANFSIDPGSAYIKFTQGDGALVFAGPAPSCSIKIWCEPANGSGKKEIKTITPKQNTGGGAAIGSNYGVYWNQEDFTITESGVYYIEWNLTTYWRSSAITTWTGTITITGSWTSNYGGLSESSTWVGNDGVVLSDSLGMSRMVKGEFKTIYGQYGLHVNNTGFKFTTDGGITWKKLVFEEKDGNKYLGWV